MSNQLTQLNNFKNELNESIQLKEEPIPNGAGPQTNTYQQSLSSLNGNQHKNKFMSQTVKNNNGVVKASVGKTFSRQLSRVNSIDNSQNSQNKNQAHPIEKSQVNGVNNPHGFSLKALSKQKNLLEKQQKFMEELMKKKKPVTQMTTSDKQTKTQNTRVSRIQSRKSSVLLGKRGSRVLNANLMAVLRQKIQEEEEKQRYSLRYRLSQIGEKIKVEVMSFLSNKYVEIIMSLFTVFSLYSEDIRQVSVTASDDTKFHIAELIVLCIFFTEVILLSFCKKNYFLSFNFWMDLVSTISLLFDIDFLTKKMFGTSVNQSNVTVLKTSRVSRIASRSTKIVRFIRLLRLTKLQQIYQKAYETLNEKYIHKEEQENDSESSILKDGRTSNPATSQQNLDFIIDKQNQSYGQNHSDFQLRLKNSERDSNQMQQQPFRKRMNSFEKNNHNNTSQNTVLRNFYRRRSLDIKETNQHRNSVQSFFQNNNNGNSNLLAINGKKNNKYSSNFNFDSGQFSDKNLNTQQNQPMLTLNSPKKQKPLERRSILSHISHNSNNSHETQQNQNLAVLASLKRDSVKQSAFYNSARNNNNNLTQQNITQLKSISFVNPGYENQKHNPSELLAHPKSKMSLNSHSSFGFDEEKSIIEEQKPKIKEKTPNNESKIGQRLADITTNRVIILIFILVVCIPFFDDSFYLTNDYGFETYIDYLKEDFENQHPTYELETQVMIQMGLQYDPTDEKFRYPLYNFITEGKNIFPTQAKPVNSYYTDLREEEIMIFSSTSSDATGNQYFETQYITKLDQDLNSYLSIGQTTFILVLLAYSTIAFVKDINKLVVSPIERMLDNIKLIADNPLNAAKISEEKAMAEQELKKNRVKFLEMSQQKNDETYLLESTIMKIGALLAIGFGEAGSKIITKNMQIGGKIDPMIPGKKIMAIFGFCSIKNFADATEILQEKVMIFANEVAELVHVCCDSFHGAINKNLGDCFLLVWKYTEDESQLFIDDTDQVKMKNLPLVQNLSDLPVAAFLKAIANARLLSLTPNFIQQHLKPLQKVMPSFKLRLGFGLHVGWGIEGAIGSNFKIDASYLSPNVNMASRLENATKQYGLYFLLSGSLYRLLSQKTQSILRHVDRVTVKGSKQPMDLYTCDVDPYLLRENKYIQKRLQDSKVNKKVLKFISRKRRTERYKKIIQGQANISSILDNDVDISKMRSNYTQEFRSTYHEGLHEYFNGDWEAAKDIFEEAQLILKESLYRAGEDDTFLDGPIQTLTNFMQKYNFKAPSNWFGYRVLLDK